MRMHVKLLSCLRAMHECARPMLSHASESQAGTATAAGGEIYVRGNDTSLPELKPLAPPWTAVSCYNTSASLLVARYWVGWLLAASCSGQAALSDKAT